MMQKPQDLQQELQLLQQSHKKVKIKSKGWLRVASDVFMDKNRFPNVPVIEANVTMPWDFITWA